MHLLLSEGPIEGKAAPDHASPKIVDPSPRGASGVRRLSADERLHSANFHTPHLCDARPSNVLAI